MTSKKAKVITLAFFCLNLFIKNWLMEFLKTSRKNLQQIIKIIGEAQEYLAIHNIDQWQNGYPNEEAILIDIINNESYIITTKESIIIGTAMFSTKKEPTYKSIEGQWITKSDAKYGVIHRMAVTNNFRKKGVAKFIFEKTLNLSAKNMRSWAIRSAAFEGESWKALPYSKTEVKNVQQLFEEKVPCNF